MIRPLTMFRLRFALLLLASAAAAFAQAHVLVENFTAPLPSSPQIISEADTTDAKVGLASAKLTYHLNPRIRAAQLDLGDKPRALVGPGVLKLWVKGNDSDHELELTLRNAVTQTGADVSRAPTGTPKRARFDVPGAANKRRAPTVVSTSDFVLPRIKLDFASWKEFSFDIPATPTDSPWSWHRLAIYASARSEKIDGVIGLDDLRFFPASNPPPGLAAIGLAGPGVREFGGPVGVFLDLRNFSAAPAKVRARVTMTDRNENAVADREFQLDLAANESKEVLLDLAPENLGAFLPPFKITGDVLSSELAALSARLDATLVLGNCRYLFDDFSDVYGRWFTVGAPMPLTDRTWVGWVQGEAQRATPLAQTTARIAPADIVASADAPPGARHALRIDYTGDAAVYNGRQRYLPGDAYRAGFWIKGDGSQTRLFAMFLDYTTGAETSNSGWKRTNEGERELAVLDFTGWRYVEVDLPGRGLGGNTPNGTTDGIDFPLELTAFRLQAAPGAKGTVLLGPIQVFTQQAQSGMLSVQLGYDDPWHRWQPALGSDVTVQNSALTGPRQVKLNWSLLDRAGESAADGQADLALSSGEAKTVRLDLAKYAAAIAKRAAPFTLQATAYDVADGSVSTTRQLILTQPDSRATVADFESDRGYLGLKAREVRTAPADGETAARTSTEQAHGGRRSLLIEWDREESARRFISIDPALPGVPVELSMWVYGDNSGALVYPVIGDRKGINHGLLDAQWNLLLPRTEDGALQNAVRVDWTGWRELKFHLPPVAPNWAETMPSLGFVPNYPLGVHLAVDATDATKDTGRIFVDDIVVSTHLKPEARMDLIFERTGESNLHTPGAPVEVVVANRDVTSPRRVMLSGGLFDWRGTRVAGLDQVIELAPGTRQTMTLAKDFPQGFYILKATLADETSAKSAAPKILASIEEDLLVADPVATLGADWANRLTNEWELRKPIGERFSFVDEDWDWVEYHPGNLQLDTVRQRAHVVTDAGSDPYMLLGYSAYWAAGPGFDQLKAGSFVRMLRDRGHAVNTFLIPARLDDWDNYVGELMRGASDDVAGWIIWDGPDGAGPMGFESGKFIPFLKAADHWRRLYGPTKPLILGGLAKDTAVNYVAELAKHGGLDVITGVNVRLDVGRLSPEDAGVVGYSRELDAVLNPPGTVERKSILFTELDWAVEKGGTGLDAFDQAAYLARTALLLDRPGIRSALTIRNGDYVRLGFGLAYRRDLLIPPMSEKPLTYQLKPAWWAMTRMRAWLDDSVPVAETEVQDIIPGRTRSLIRQTKDGCTSAILWRNNDAGQVSFAGTGLKVAAAEDLFGTTVPVTDGWYAVGKIPCRFTLAEAGEPVALALGRLRVRDGAEIFWPQCVLAAFTPATGARQAYVQTGGTPATLAGRTATGETRSSEGLTFAAGGSERFHVDVPAGAGLVLRKHYLLDATGQQAEIVVNGKPAGTWDLHRTEAELSGGLREAVFVIDAALLAGRPQADIEVRYLTASNTAAWRVFECRTGVFPLSAVGPLHADQSVGSPRFARNIVGGPLRIGTQSFANGIGVFARSLLEFPLNRQFTRFTAKVGVDAVTDGRGSVVFEVEADGKKLWSSQTLSGLDASKNIDLDVTGVNRLRLVVTDAGDGNRFAVAVWGDPVLKRQTTAAP